MDHGNGHQRAARLLTNVLNPFFIFTALYVLIAFSEANATQATLYVGAELAATIIMSGYVFLLRLRGRVGDFWISVRAERLVPALVLLGVSVALLGALALLGVPGILLRTTFSIALASAAITGITFFWKASAHSAVAGHATVAGLLVLGLPSLLFALLLPFVLWSRVALGAHTLSQALAGMSIGAAFALLFLA